MIGDLDPPGRRGAQAGDDAEQCGLAATRRADERQELAALDRERNLAERFDRAGRRRVRHADPVEDDQRQLAAVNGR